MLLKAVSQITLTALLGLTLFPLGASAAETVKAAAPQLSDTQGGVRLTITEGEIKTEKGKDGGNENKFSLGTANLAPAFDRLKSQHVTGSVYVDFKAAAPTVRMQISDKVLTVARTAMPNAMLVLSSGEISYSLPLSVFKDVAAELGAEPSQTTIVVSFRKVPETALDKVQQSAEKLGVDFLLPQPVDFQILGTRANGKTVEVKKFGATFVERTIHLPFRSNPDSVTAVTYDSAAGQLQFVPATFTETEQGTDMTIRTNHNGWYTAVTGVKTFDDIQGHWAQGDIELLASKLLTKGTGEGTFAPDQPVTRAEFASMLVRALGLADNRYAVKYSDVTKYQWFTGAVGAAAEAGLIEGYEDGTFKPMSRITREQMALMLTKAMAYAGRSTELTAEQQSELLAGYTDAGQISGYAREAAAQVLQAGLLQGVSETSFAPKSQATRAQAITLLKRMMQEWQLID